RLIDPDPDSTTRTDGRRTGLAIFLMNANSSKLLRLGAALSLLAALLAFAVRAVAAQTPAPAQGVPDRLSLGDAARLAASRTAAVQSAEYRVNEAQARVTQSRSSLLPQVSAVPNWTSHTINSASFGFNFPAPPGQPPLLDPNGQIIGPVNFWDLRAQASQSVYDRAAVERVHAEQAATTAANIYVRALRSDAALVARTADSTLAADLLTIAQDQLTAGVGVALDVTRAASQLASARAQLIVARNDRDRARLDLRRALDLPLDT